MTFVLIPEELGSSQLSFCCCCFFSLFFSLFLVCFCSQLSYSLAFSCTLAGLQFILYLHSSPTTTAILVSTLGLELLQALLEMKSVTLEEIRSYLPSHSDPPNPACFLPYKISKPEAGAAEDGNNGKIPIPSLGYEDVVLKKNGSLRTSWFVYPDVELLPLSS